MEKVSMSQCERIAGALEERKKYLLSAYCHAANEIEHTLSKLSHQVDRLGTHIEDLDLSAVRYRILSSILDDAGITELLHEMDDLSQEQRSRPEAEKFLEALMLLSLDNWKDIYSYIKQVDKAIKLLRAD